MHTHTHTHTHTHIHTHTSNKNQQNAIESEYELANPIHAEATQSLTKYSSLGPAYEHVEASRESGYDVINRRGAPRPHPPMTLPGSHDPTISQEYSTLGHADQEQNSLRDEHNDTMRMEEVELVDGRSVPQDYEIPVAIK